MNPLPLFRCPADPTRPATLKLLGSGEERCVGGLVSATDRERTNVSHPLAHLRASGLVTTRRDGTPIRYRIPNPSLTALVEDAARLAAHTECADADASATGACC